MSHRSFPLALPLAIGCIALGCQGSDDVLHSNAEVVHGSGVLAEEQRSISACDGLSMSTTGDLYITTGAPESLRVEAEDNLLPYLETYVQNGILRIRTAGGVDLRPTLPIEFHLVAPTLDSIVHTGVGRVEAQGLAGNRLTVTHSGVSTMRFDDLDVNELLVTIGGVGNVQPQGSADLQILTLTGVGDYEAAGLVSTEAVVTITGLGSATVRASDRLEATITGQGSVYYYGDPALTTTITGSGQVVRLGD